MKNIWATSKQNDLSIPMFFITKCAIKHCISVLIQMIKGTPTQNIAYTFLALNGEILQCFVRQKQILDTSYHK